MFPYPKYTTKTGFVKMTVLLVAGARPNFMKIAPLYRACPSDIQCKIVHTGQHYDTNMSQVFFDELGIPEPDYNLGVGSGTHAEQTAKIMTAFERVLDNELPDLVIVVGDVNSTLSCAIVSKKNGIKLAHVEAGLRSWDMSMPEEINRQVTDAISDYHFVTETAGMDNLVREGKLGYLVGDVMIDNLFYQTAKLNGNKIGDKPYGFLTLHRQSNVDNKETFQEIISAINEISEDLQIYFPVHPRTAKMMNQFGIELERNVIWLPPLGFMDALIFWREAQCVFTDSGGLQIETSALGVPCVTLRNNTERPVTIEQGTNVLAGTSKEGILNAYDAALQKKGQAIPLNDGKVSERIWKILGELE